MSHTNNASPTTQPVAGYVGIHQLSFQPVNPNALGVANRTPINTLGNIAQRVTSKVGGLAKSSGQVARIVIATQQARL